ncbi:MAG: hypothetical protein AAGC85_02405 [Bacteroidota bacterium]
MLKRLCVWVLVGMNFLYAQNGPNLAVKTKGFYTTTIKPMFPWVILIVFVITALYNISDLMGENRDYKRFFTRIGLFLGGTLMVIAIVNYLATLSI